MFSIKQNAYAYYLNLMLNAKCGDEKQETPRPINYLFLEKYS